MLNLYVSKHYSKMVQWCNGAMEADTIKNAVSPKDQMSRGNQKNIM
jgi:hypothetical protein